MDREGNVVDVLGLRGESGETPHIGENGNWFIGDIDTGVPARGEGGGSSVEADETLTVAGAAADAKVVGERFAEQAKAIADKADKTEIPKVFDWAIAELPFTADQLSGMVSGAGFVESPTNFEDGVTYFRYHAGATSFTWTNPNPQAGAVTITVLAWSQYMDKTAATQLSALNIVYGDGTTGRLSLVNGQTVSMTTDAGKVLTKIRGIYDHENWVLLDMSVLTIVADYPAPTGTVKSVNGNLPDADGNVKIDVPEGSGTSAEVMTGASATAAGKAGLVPAPAAGDNEKFLAGDGTWKTPEGSGGDLSLGVTGAAVGQIARITAVDDTGKPTAWEAVDAASGEVEWDYEKTIELEEEVSEISITTFDDGTPLALKKVECILVNSNKTSSNNNIVITPDYEKTDAGGSIFAGGGIYLTADKWHYLYCVASIEDGIVTMEHAQETNVTRYVNCYSGMSGQLVKEVAAVTFSNESQELFPGKASKFVEIEANTPKGAFTVGSVLRIRGVRA